MGGREGGEGEAMIFLDIALAFLIVGLLSLGGGYAMIPLLQREAAKFGILGREFCDVVALAEMTPGPVGVNLSTYTGYKVAGILGAIVATASNVAPTAILMLMVVKLFYRIRADARVEEFFRGFRLVVIGLIAAAALLMAEAIGLYADYKGLAIFSAALALGYRYRIHPIPLILAAGVAGLLIY
ncbi:MAG: chromate transporter [Candidatus Bathyarchaeia archaeon]